MRRQKRISGHPILPDGRYYVSRIIGAEKLGRPLKTNEDAHHKNGDSTDDRRRNIIVLPEREHILHHRVGSKHKPSTLKKMAEAQKRRFRLTPMSDVTKKRISRNLKGKGIGRVPANFIPTSNFKSVDRRNLTDREKASLLGVSIRTFYRRKT